ncbi:sigma-54-dependent Fis family transcriptional regulator [bacterium]|nr:MAG: sigma-54-dependent Fis family transcriptional regulator [bacterium]
MKNVKITSEDWGFFEDVSRAAFANPFGRARGDLDLRIGGASPEIPSGAILGAALAKIEEKAAGFGAKGGTQPGRYEGRRGEILRDVVLFHLFHKYIAEFDSLIREQEKKGSVLVPAPFAERALKEIENFGFTPPVALKVFAFFYQLRRGFYFIRNGLVGSSPAMADLRMHLWNVVFTCDIRWFEERFWERMEEFTILLVGETGTGKGAAAAAIGKSGFIPYNPSKNSFTESFASNFVSINLSQYSEGLIESELFGHKKGSFTGAIGDHEGLFSRCAPHGTIFIDEIGDIGVSIQIKLLQVLQDRVFFPVGSHSPKSFRGRVVAATNRPLQKLRREGKFREDLYYRISSDVIALPPLRERLREEPGELDLLLESILKRLSGEIAPEVRDFVKSAILRDAGESYGWPGNVRELEQAVKRIILTGRYQPQPSAEDEGGYPGSIEAKLRGGKLTADEVVELYTAMLYERFGSYEEVARRAGIDRRTAKKHILKGRGRDDFKG